MALIRVRVRGLMMDERNKQPIVVLQEEEGERVLPIWIGEAEARAIGIVLTREQVERPLTHDLGILLIKGLKARVTGVAITALRNNTFFAEIRLESEAGEQVLIDARPSDSIAIALRSDAPISVEEEVLDSGQATSVGAKPVEKSKKEQAEELRRFLEDMDPGDFGRFGV
jgi:bifunctional DNase/RNase